MKRLRALALLLLLGSTSTGLAQTADLPPIVQVGGTMPAPVPSWAFGVGPVMGNGLVYVFGAAVPGAGCDFSDAIRTFDTTTYAWSTLPTKMPYGYYTNEPYSAARAANGRIYIGPGNGCSGWGTHNRIIEFDPATGLAVEKAALAGGNVWGMSMAAAGNGVYLFGGWNGGGLGEVRYYDPATDSVQVVASLTAGRSVPTVVSHPNGGIYLIGGNTMGTIDVFERFTPGTNTLVRLPNPAGVRSYGAAAWVGLDGRVYFLNASAESMLGSSSGMLYSIDPATDEIRLEGANGTTHAQFWRAVQPEDRSSVFLLTSYGKDQTFTSTAFRMELMPRDEACFDVVDVPALHVPGWVYATTGDALNDGTEQVVGVANATSVVQVIRVSAGGAQTIAHEIPTTPAPGLAFAGLHVGEFDGDGKDDIALYSRANNRKGTLVVLLYRDGPSGPTWEERRFPMPETDAGYNMEFADFDGDGRTDVVTTDLGYSAGPNGWVTLNDGLLFTRSTQLPVGPGGFWPKAYVGDLDADARPDVVVAANYVGLGGRVFRNTGGGSFSFWSDLPAAGGTQGATSVAIGDLGGDGIADIVTNTFIPHNFSHAAAVYRQAGGAFSGPTTLTPGSEVRTPVLRDFDGDGYVDLAVDNAHDRTIAYFRGTAGGLEAAPTTLSHTILSAGGHGDTGANENLFAGDVNGDGRPDLLHFAEFAVLLLSCDRTPPVLTLPAPMEIDATSPDGAAVAFSATAMDAVDGAVAVSCTPASGSLFPVGTTAVTCSAVDAHGNAATGSFPITVRPFGPPPVTVVLVDSTGAGIPGAVVSYYQSSWQPFGVTGADGRARLALPAGSYSFRVELGGGAVQKTQHTGTNPVVSFQTVNVLVRLRDSLGNALDTGTADYYAGSWHSFGVTSGGEVRREMLPTSYSFAMTYLGGRVQVTQNVALNAVVAFQTRLVSSRLRNSQGAPLDTGTAEYYAGSWRPFGTTQGGEVSRELLPTSYSFAMTYEGGRVQVTQDVSVNPVVAFQTREVVVGLRSSADLPLDGGVVEYYAGSWRPFGTTAGGEARKELLPTSYSFGMKWAGGRVQLTQNVASSPSVAFQTGAVLSDSGTCTSYYATSWKPFTQGIELLPGTYPFTFSTGTPSQQSFAIAAGVNNHIR